MGDLSIGKMHKDSSQKLCNLLVCRKTARVGRARAARKTEKTPTLRSRSLIRKEVNISEMLVRMVESRTPHLARQRVPNRQTASAYLIGFVIGIIPHCFSLGALVHICIPQTDTPCGEMSLSGWSYSLSWAFPLRVAFPHLCVLIIAHFWLFVKRFLKKMRNFFSVAFATTHLYRVLLPSIGCFLLPLHSCP